MILSDEPGYYEDGKFGIRIENIVKIVPADTKHNFQGTLHSYTYLQHCGSGSGSKRAKINCKIRKNWRNVMFWSAGCSLLRAEVFPCHLDVLHGGLGIEKKSRLDFFSCKILCFGSSEPWIRIRVDLKWCIQNHLDFHRNQCGSTTLHTSTILLTSTTRYWIWQFRTESGFVGFSYHNGSV